MSDSIRNRPRIHAWSKVVNILASLLIDWYEWNRDGEVYGVAAALPRNRKSSLTSNEALEHLDETHTSIHETTHHSSFYSQHTRAFSENVNVLACLLWVWSSDCVCTCMPLFLCHFVFAGCQLYPVMCGSRVLERRLWRSCVVRCHIDLPVWSHRSLNRSRQSMRDAHDEQITLRRETESHCRSFSLDGVLV
jgi:hypothetical protein